MKQRITPEQLKELTPEQKERLREWWRPVKGDSYIWDSPLSGMLGPMVYDGVSLGKALPQENSKGSCLPLLTVGQCIALLKEKAPKLLCALMMRMFNSFVVILDKETGVSEEFSALTANAVELIDVLWDGGIKAVL